MNLTKANIAGPLVLSPGRAKIRVPVRSCNLGDGTIQLNFNGSKQGTAFQTRNGLRLPDVTFRFSGDSPNSSII